MSNYNERMQNGLARIAYNEVRGRERTRARDDNDSSNIFLIFLLPFIPVIVVGYVTWMALVLIWYNLRDVLEILRAGFMVLVLIYIVWLMIKIIGKEKFTF